MQTKINENIRYMYENMFIIRKIISDGENNCMQNNISGLRIKKFHRNTKMPTWDHPQFMYMV